MSVFIEIAVGDGQLSPADAHAIAAAAQRAGITGLRLRDDSGDRPALDPSVLGAHLAARAPALGYLIDAATTHNAPYNLARRLQSFDRATAGRVGLILRPGDGDDVSAAATPDPEASDPAQRWTEYAAVLTGLWESFPRSALIGDRHEAIALDDRQIRAVDHAGRFYRVAGPLDGPASIQGRPVLVAADVAALGWQRIAAVADAAIIDDSEWDAAEAALEPALTAAGRPRAAFALLVRINSAGDLGARLRLVARADGMVLAIDGAAEQIIAAVHELAALDVGRTGPTLRARLGLPLVGAA